MKTPNTIGQVFGRLTVIGLAVWIAASIGGVTWPWVCGNFQFVCLF